MRNSSSAITRLYAVPRLAGVVPWRFVSYAPPDAVRVDPGAVKRLANSYGLLTAIRRAQREDYLSDQHATIRDPHTGDPRDVTYRPHRAGMIMLAALVAYPALRPALFLHLHHTATTNPDHTWPEYLATLQPHQQAGHWRNPADPHMTPVQAQQWQALLDGLHHTHHTAAAHGLPLPEPLAAWVSWVVPVGRLSFPTGRIVSTLDPQRPLSTHPNE